MGFAASIPGNAPVGGASTFIADPGLPLTPSLISELNVGPVMLVANIGARIRATLRDLDLGSAMGYRVGAQWAVIPDFLALDAEVYGRYQLSENSNSLDANGVPMEVLAGPKVTLPSGISVMLGVGAGVLAGYGAARPASFLASRMLPH